MSAADPLNLVGTVLPGARVASLASNRIVYRDGAAIATLAGGTVEWLQQLDAADARFVESLLIRRPVGSPLLAYLR